MQSMTRAEKNYFSVFHLFILTPDPALFARSQNNNKTIRLDTKNNEAAGYLGPAEIELRKGAGL